MRSKEHSCTRSPQNQFPFQDQSSSRSEEEEKPRSAAVVNKSLPNIALRDDQALMQPPEGGYHCIQSPSLYQPFKVDEYQSSFLQQFIAAFFISKADPTRPNIWVYQLPSVLKAAPSSALICSIRAATLAHYGRRNGNPAIQQEACHWYDKGLESQRLESHETELQLANGENAAEKITEATICAPILFALFESLMIRINFGYDYSRFVEQSGFQTEASEWIIKETRPSYFQDTFAATNIAMYDAASILASSHAWETTSSDPAIHKQRIVTHYASILAAVAYHESRGISSGGSVSIVFPMKIACKATPSDHQRQLAEIALLRWGESRGVDSICKFRAVPEGNDLYRGTRITEDTRDGYSETT